MLGLLYILLIFAALTIHRYSKWSELIILIGILLIVYWAVDIPDFNNYQNVYKAIGAGSLYNDTGIGWYVLCKIGNFLHLDYKAFDMAIITASLLLIRSSVCCFISNGKMRCWIWGLYLIYPLLMDLVQIRFLLSTALILFAVPWLMFPYKHGGIRFLLMLAISYTIHSSAIFYFIFFVAYYLKRLSYGLIGLLTALGMVASLFKTQLIALMSNFTNGARIERYLRSTDGAGVTGLATYLGILIIFVWISWLLIRQSREEGYEKSLYKFQLRVNQLMFLVLPLCLYDTNFIRLQRPMYLILYITLGTFRRHHRTLKIGSEYSISSDFLSVGVACLGVLIMMLQQNWAVFQAFLW